MSQALSFWEDSICIFNVDMHILSDKKKDQKEEGKKKKEEAGKHYGRERMVLLVVGENICFNTYSLFVLIFP